MKYFVNAAALDPSLEPALGPGRELPVLELARTGQVPRLQTLRVQAPRPHGKRRTGRGKRGSGRERGEISIEAVIIFPIVVTMMFVAIQAAFTWYTRNALQIAASDALSTRQTISTGYTTPDSEIGTIDGVARTSLQRSAAYVNNLTVWETEPQPGYVTIHVQARIAGYFPGMTRLVEGRASGPLDAFRPQGQP